MSEYAMSRAEARQTPMAEAFALRTAVALRHGWTWGEANYAERET